MAVIPARPGVGAEVSKAASGPVLPPGKAARGVAQAYFEGAGRCGK